MKNDIYKLFVYGSLRSGFRSPAYEYLTRFFHLMGEAVVKGKLYDHGNYPVATATEEDHFIIGELYELNNPAEFSWAIGQLDDYEGLGAPEGELSLFKRETSIIYQNGIAHIAWIYWYDGNIDGLPVMKTGDVLNYEQEKHRPL